MKESGIAKGHKATAFQLGLLVFTVLLLCALVADTVLVLPRELAKLVHIMDTFACAVFLVDFCVRFHHAESKAAFMKWGWVDLIACVPNLDIFRWGRMVRVLRVIRLLRGIRSVRRVLALVFQDRLQGGTATAIFTAFMLIAFSSAGILVCERQADANITTAEDALWWTVSTFATGGCSDKYPVTTEGRALAMVLMIAGVGMIGATSGIVASLFMGSHEPENIGLKDIAEKLKRLEAKLDGLALVQSRGGPERP
jgi:voltage-gated potassium channel